MLKWYFDWGSRERDWGRTGERDEGSAEDGMAGRAGGAPVVPCGSRNYRAVWKLVRSGQLLRGSCRL